jgi:hypothetical protein
MANQGVGFGEIFQLVNWIGSNQFGPNRIKIGNPIFKTLNETDAFHRAHPQFCTRACSISIR